MPRPRVACCPLLLRRKVDRTRAPPARLSLCSQTLLERAGRFVLADKETSDRERRHESVSARPDSDVVGVVVRRMVREAGAQPLGWDRGLT